MISLCALQTLLIDTNVTISVLNITLDKLDLGTNLTCRAINPYIDSAPMEHTWTVDLGCKYLIAISQMSLLSPTVTSPAGIRRLFLVLIIFSVSATCVHLSDLTTPLVPGASARAGPQRSNGRTRRTKSILHTTDNVSTWQEASACLELCGPAQ